MLRGVNQTKKREWTERLERYLSSGRTVAEFCKAEGVSVPSFYQWKRKLRQSSSGAGKSRKSGAANRFKPVSVVTPHSPAPISVRLPDGIVIELQKDSETLREVIGLVLDRQSGMV